MCPPPSRIGRHRKSSSTLVVQSKRYSWNENSSVLSRSQSCSRVSIGVKRGDTAGRRLEDLLSIVEAEAVLRSLGYSVYDSQECVSVICTSRKNNKEDATEDTRKTITHPSLIMYMIIAGIAIIVARRLFEKLVTANVAVVHVDIVASDLCAQTIMQSTQMSALIENTFKDS
jgi:hypothetical protein